jgi:hypothetical protein
MSVSRYLRCKDTKKAVHVAEQSSRWFRGPDYPDVLGVFCVAHDGKELDVVDGDHFTHAADFMEYEVWTPENVKAEYMALVGKACAGF